MNDEADSVFLTILYMVLFYFIYSISELALIVLAVVQVLLSLLSGKPNPNLQRFGVQLGEYVAAIVRYISMASTEKPYPFSDWPAASESAQEES